MKQAVLGMVATPAQAENLAAVLVRAGFADSAVSVLSPERHLARDFAYSGDGGRIPGPAVKMYEGKVKHGYTLVAVEVQSADERNRAKEAFESVGAQDVAAMGDDGGAREHDSAVSTR